MTCQQGTEGDERGEPGTVEPEVGTAEAAALAIDIGGTFTDVVLVAGGRLHRAKTLTTPDDPWTGYRRGQHGTAGGAGVVAAVHVGRSCGRSELIAFDMGGTTAKAGEVRDGRPEITPQLPRRREGELRWPSRRDRHVGEGPCDRPGRGRGRRWEHRLAGRWRCAARRPALGQRRPGPAFYGLGGEGSR